MKISVISFVSGIIFCILFFYAKPVNKRPVINTDEISIIADSVKNINSGGCGYFAMKLLERLDTNEYSACVINDYNHVVVMDNKTGALIDSKGYRHVLALNIIYNTTKFTVISFDSLKRAVYTGKWNRLFNRNDTVLINKYINQL